MKFSDKTLKWFFDNNFLNAIYRQALFVRHHGYFLNLIRPKTYDDKVNWLILNQYDASYGKYADKYKVREYVESVGLGDTLAKLYGVYDSFEEIDYKSLPDKYVLMLNHGSGPRCYFINRGRYSKEELEERFNAAKKYMSESLKENYYLGGGERQYEAIERKILCIEYLEDEGKDFLSDYKVVCSYGKTIAILVCTERNKGRDYYSIDWDYLPYVKDRFKSQKNIAKPLVLDDMLKAASILSKDLPLARVDFYIVDGKLYFGEITLTPNSGNHKNLNYRGEKEIGSQIRLVK